MSDSLSYQSIVYFCGSRVLAHGPVSADDSFTVLAQEAESARKAGISYLLGLIAKKGDRIQPRLLRDLADLLEHQVESCRTTKKGYLERAVAGHHGIPIAHPNSAV